MVRYKKLCWRHAVYPQTATEAHVFDLQFYKDKNKQDGIF